MLEELLHYIINVTSSSFDSIDTNSMMTVLEQIWQNVVHDLPLNLNRCNWERLIQKQESSNSFGNQEMV